MICLGRLYSPLLRQFGGNLAGAGPAENVMVEFIIISAQADGLVMKRLLTQCVTIILCGYAAGG